MFTSYPPLSHVTTSSLGKGGIALVLFASLLFGACKQEGNTVPIETDTQAQNAQDPEGPTETPFESQSSQSYTPDTSHSYEPLTSQSYEPNTSQSYTPNTSHSYTPTTSISYEPRAQEESIAETELHDRE